MRDIVQLPLSHFLLLLALSLGAPLACSDDPGNNGTPAQPGSEQGPCYGNGTCDSGLSCIDALCVPTQGTPGADMSSSQDMSGGGNNTSTQDMSAPQQDMSATPDLSSSQDMSASYDMSASSDLGQPQDMAPPMPMRIDEQEPNDGKSLSEINDLPLDAVGRGAIATPGDADVWRVDAERGKIYTVTLTAPAGSMLSPSLTVIDAGRNDKGPGEDYVKLADDDGSGQAQLSMVAMGEGGYYLAVRDLRDVGASRPENGSAAHTYEIAIEELPLTAVQGNITFPMGQVSDQLAAPGALRIYPFMASQGQELRADLRATAPDQLDARLFVFSIEEGSWIARQDNRTLDDIDPLLDAPLYANGAMWLIVENIDPSANSLGYTLSVSLGAP